MIEREDTEGAPESITALQDNAILVDAELQAEYLRRFQEQLRRVSCAGCGGTELL